MANHLSEIDWFMWNGKKSTDYGIHVLNQPSYTSPKERYSSVTIPGRSGSFIVTEGDDIYDNITITVTCVVDDIFLQTHAYDIFGYESGNGFSTKDILRTYLKGTGNLTFPHMYVYENGVPKRLDYYRARVSNQIDFAQVVAGNPHRTFQIVFDCEPYIYLEWGNTGQQLVQVESTDPTRNKYMHTFPNEGNVYAKPLIAIACNGNVVELQSTNTETGEILKTLWVSALPTGVTCSIDCDAKVAYASDGTLLTGYLVGDWLELPTGRGDIVQYGDSLATVVYPRYRRI